MSVTPQPHSQAIQRYNRALHCFAWQNRFIASILHAFRRSSITQSDGPISGAPFSFESTWLPHSHNPELSYTDVLSYRTLSYDPQAAGLAPVTFQIEITPRPLINLRPPPGSPDDTRFLILVVFGSTMDTILPLVFSASPPSSDTSFFWRIDIKPKG